MTIKCKICKHEFGSHRLHCPCCSTLSVRAFGRVWTTHKDGKLHRVIARARNAADVVQQASRGMRAVTVDGD